jgi:hypothetical protein
MDTGLRMLASIDPPVTGEVATIRSGSGVRPIPDWLAS